MREIRADVFQGRFHNLLISKNNTFWVPQISRITFQVVTVRDRPGKAQRSLSLGYLEHFELLCLGSKRTAATVSLFGTAKGTHGVPLQRHEVIEEFRGPGHRPSRARSCPINQL